MAAPIPSIGVGGSSRSVRLVWLGVPRMSVLLAHFQPQPLGAAADRYFGTYQGGTGQPHSRVHSAPFLKGLPVATGVGLTLAGWLAL